MIDNRISRRRMLAVSAAAGAGLALAPGLSPLLAQPGRLYKIGACDWSIGKGGSVDALDLAKELGLEGVQVSFGEPGAGDDLRNIYTRMEYQGRAKRLGVEISSLAMGVLNGIPLAESDDAEQWVGECIKVMKKMKQRCVLLAFFGKGDLKGNDAAQKQVIERLKRLAPEAEKAGVALGLETTMSMDEHLRIIDAVGSPAVQVYYDVANSFGYGPYDELRALGKKKLLCEVHCKENGFLLGEGRVDFNKVHDVLQEVEYPHWLIIEGAVPQGMQMPEAYARNQHYLRTVFPAAKVASPIYETLDHEMPFKISLAEWSLHRMLNAKKLDNLDFPKFAKDRFDIEAVEYVNQFFKDKADDKAYLTELNKRAAAAGVKNVLIMVDGEGAIGDPDDAKRTQAIENHKKWVRAAKFLGCHSIRVNAQSQGSREEQLRLAADGLGRLSDYAKTLGINVIVENHGGLSSDGAWLAAVMKAVGKDNCGTLPDFGNFHDYDRYQGVTETMPFAKGVSAKSHEFDQNGAETKSDYFKLMNIVLDAGYSGYVGIEWEGGGLSEVDGIRATQRLLKRVRTQIAATAQLRKEKGLFLGRENWKVVRVDSQETSGENGRAQNALDGNFNNFWHTEWSASEAPYPHELVVDTGATRDVKGFFYLPRQDGPNGRILEYELYVGDDPKQFGAPAVKGKFPNTEKLQKVKCQAVKGRYFMLRALSEQQGQPYASAAELGLLQ